MNARLVVLSCLILPLISPLTVLANDEWTEQSDVGKTDWINGYVEATGQGTSKYMSNRIQEELMAKQAARTMAQAKLLEQVQGIRLTGITTIGETRAATRVKGTLKGARTVSEQVTWHKDSSSRRGEVALAEVTLRLCMTSACGESKTNLSGIVSSKSTDTDTNPTSPPISSGPSSVIIDLNQALYLPALSPEIISESGEVVYSQDTAQTEGSLVHYAKSIKKAKALSISGTSPLIIQAQKITDDNRIVLSTADQQKIQDLEALKHGRLVVALD